LNSFVYRFLVVISHLSLRDYPLTEVSSGIRPRQPVTVEIEIASLNQPLSGDPASGSGNICNSTLIIGYP